MKTKPNESRSARVGTTVIGADCGTGLPEHEGPGHGPRGFESGLFGLEWEQGDVPGDEGVEPESLPTVT